jgi:hypothetical protein
MIMKRIEFEDFDGNKVTETHWFHLSKADLIDWLTVEPNLAERLASVATKSDGADIIKTFKEFVGASIGERVEGNASAFHKSDKIRNNFMGSLAFDALLDELVENPSSAVELLKNLLPKSLMQAVEGGAPAPIQSMSGTGEPKPWANRKPTAKELQSMSNEDLQMVYARDQLSGS